MNEKRPLGFKRPLELPALLRPVLSRRLIVAALFGWMLFSNGSNAMRMSWTYDEPQHLEYGMRFLSGDPGQGGHSNLASSALNAVPVRIGQTLRKAIPSSPLCLGDARVGRFATILFSLITAFYVMRWARQMYGDDAGIFCLFLYAFEPNLQAHSQLITTDIFAAGMGLICVYYLWRYFKSESEKSFLKYCLSVGLSQLAKYTCLLIYPVFLVIVIVRRCFLPQLAHSRKASAGVIAWAVRILVLVAISVATINFVYIFDRNRFASGLPEVGRSGLFQTLNRHPIPAVAIDAVLPPAYREGLDAILFFGENTLMTGSHYLLGRLQDTPPFEGFMGYFFIASLFKVPLPIQVLVIWAFVCYWFKRRQFIFYKNEVFLFVPIAFYFIFFNFFSKANIGIRFYLVAFPFYIIFCGSLVRRWRVLSPLTRGGIAALCVWLIVSALSYFPEYIPYMNELVPDRKMAYKILADSNLDWGQGSYPYLDDYLLKNPRAIVMPTTPVAGEVLVPVNYLVGVWDPRRYAWLRENFTPVRHVGYAWLVFHVTKEDLERLKILKSVASKPSSK